MNIVHNALEYISIVVQIFTLFTLLFGVTKIVTVAERHHVELAMQIQDHAARIKALESSMHEIIELVGTVRDVKDEITRVRNRLDQFLDRKYGS